MFGKKEIASVLLCASILGQGKTSAFGLREFFVTSGLLFGSYVVANEVAGNTGRVSYPAFGGFTVKKTIDYFKRDVEKEKELIDNIVNAFSALVGGGRLIGKLSKLTSDKQIDKSKMSDLVGGFVKETESLINSLIEDVLPRVKVDSCSISGISLDDSKINNEAKGRLLVVLWAGIASLSFIRSQLNKIGFVDYSLGFKFDHSARSIRMRSSKGILIFTLNNDNSLKFSMDGKDPKNRSIKLNMTIFPPEKSKE